MDSAFFYQCILSRPRLVEIDFRELMSRTAEGGLLAVFISTKNRAIDTELIIWLTQIYYSRTKQYLVLVPMQLQCEEAVWNSLEEDQISRAV